MADDMKRAVDDETKAKPLFYASGKVVFRSPVYQKTKGGTNISIGFPVVTVHEAVEDGEVAAKKIAQILCENEERL